MMQMSVEPMFLTITRVYPGRPDLIRPTGRNDMKGGERIEQIANGNLRRLRALHQKGD